MCLEIIYLIYMYKEDLVLNNLQVLICHKTQPNHSSKENSQMHTFPQTISAMWIAKIRSRVAMSIYYDDNHYTTNYIFVKLLLKIFLLTVL